MKKIITLITLFLIIFLFIVIFIYSKDVAESITFSISIWKDTLIPSLFPFFLVSDLLLEYGFIELISKLFGKYMVKIFNLPKESSYAFFISLFSGFPSGSKYVKDLLERNLITKEDANLLIMFTHYSNPLFIVSTIGVFLLNNIYLGYLILFSHIVSNILIALIFRKKKKTFYNDIPFKETIKNIINKKREGFATILVNSIWKSFKILVNMLGIIMFFLIISTLINKVFNINSYLKIIISSILEMTQGVKTVSSSTIISFNLKAPIIGAIISFSGISVHFQVKSIIDNSGILYKNFLIARIIQSILCFIIIYTITMLSQFL